jgi:uncharacterized phage-associated protein
VIKFGFNPPKSTQAAAALLKWNGGDMDKYLFIKMLYLADREALGRWQEPITGDSAASMQFGPVLSTIYNLTKGECPGCREEWEQSISDCDDQTNRITLLGDPGDSELSAAELKILHSIFEKFKDFGWKQMRDYSHALGEYDDKVGKSSRPISVEKILTALGKTPQEIEEAECRFRQIKVAEMLLTDC